jgi:protein TonB
MKTVLAIAAVAIAGIAGLAGCANQVGPEALDPYGRPYLDENRMPPTPVSGCDPRDLESSPKLISGTQPLFPVGEMLAGHAEAVTVRFEVDVDGRAHILENAAENHAFADHAAIAMRDWKFEPARRGGRPVAATCAMVFDYHLP